MRLWSYEILDVLPRLQLISQWRECLGMKRGLEKDNLNHGLVNYIKKYPTALFYWYTYEVAAEMERRGINFQRKYLEEIEEFCVRCPMNDEMVYPEHNERYLRECLYNLEEKAMRGMIPKEEWNKIYVKYKDKFDLWNGEN